MFTNGSSVSVLFVRKNSVYKTLGVDVWDQERDAMKWPGGNAIVAHPPCRLWGRLRQFSTADESEKELALWSVKQVQTWGGVLEHPYGSTLWETANLPKPNQRDKFGGWTMPINQFMFGHEAEKKTWLYIVGCEPQDIPDFPLVLGRAESCIRPRKTYPRLKSLSRAKREYTPIDLATWLIELADKCNGYDYSATGKPIEKGRALP